MSRNIKTIAVKSEFIRNGNTKLHVNIYSSHLKEVIIVLHGGPGVPDEMLEVVDVLKENYQVIYFEQRGVGLSACEEANYKMEAYISDIDAICSHLSIYSFHLFGHSWGGLYAQIYAKEKPAKIKSLFLCSPSSGTNNTWKKTEMEVMQLHKEICDFKEWFHMGWFSLFGMLGIDEAYQKLFRQVLKNYHKNYGEVDFEDAFFDKIYAAPVNKTRKEIMKYKPLTIFSKPDFPVLISYGDADIYGESKGSLIGRFPTATVEIINTCGHIPWKHNAAAFQKLLNKFYSQKEI
ncbi:alpha/beta fold hydrolase [Flavicella sediminum]|uniref:alpha/beta fold hydrolase n=1 Tax=Flavicella sediminum TaxID=2585141 RepID=UPI0011215D0C|nr:alpha/beta hydrolase [Flavicella sediminum]